MDWKIFDPANGIMTLPDSLGIYIISCNNREALPGIMRHLSYVPILGEYPVMYIGKSGKAGISKRYQDHFRGTARNSTLRKSLGVLFEYGRHYYTDGRYRFDDEQRLSGWMKKNLVFIYCIVDDPDVDALETDQIEQYHPPLNLKNNTSEINRDFRNILIRLRNDFPNRDTRLDRPIE